MTVPHVSFNCRLIKVLALRCNTIVSQMHEFIMKPRGIVVVTSESKVRRCEDEYLQRLPRSYNHPLTNVKFLVQNDKGIFKILLDNPDLVITSLRCLFNIRHNCFKFIVDCNASSSRLRTWFQNPSVLCSNYTELIP